MPIFAGMKRATPFQFKHFRVHQDKSAMKIGTDGVLLGAWAGKDTDPESILDIGAGTGVIALQMAQRFDAETIDAVELDENAFLQTVENFERSDWADRLFCYHSSFQEFAHEFAQDGEGYQLVVSNPPFYTATNEASNKARTMARFTSALDFNDLLTGVDKILAKDGIFAVVIPFSEESNFIAMAQNNSLCLSRRCRVQGTPTSEVKRSLLEFGRSDKVIAEESLTIEVSRHQYTESYRALVQDFYVKM